MNFVEPSSDAKPIIAGARKVALAMALLWTWSTKRSVASLMAALRMKSEPAAKPFTQE